MRTRIPILIVTTTLTLIASQALAEPPFNHGAEPGVRPQQMQVMLDLTPEQQESIKAIVDSKKEASAPLREQAQAYRQKMQALKQAETFDEARARELAHLQADTRVSIMALRHETRREIDALLTPDQLQKKEEIHELRRQQRSEERGWRKKARFGAGTP